ncbi:MAG: Luciferase-like monooxygenase [Pseudomonadota bacterium]|jgi:alkanesulfonate monooxygenase SsuD/methylene tetrahydromethanopterin reductase-like flavin-dependent oxidoreductase (luciferase family)
MLFDVFFSICQTPVDGVMPNERDMFRNFFEQVEAADDLGYGVAWIAESHLSCEVQKQNPGAVIPNFVGEIGLNTDIFLLAPHIFARTRKIEIGSAIKSLFCNGGPIAHAEALKSFLSLHQFTPDADRKIHLGVAAGRFPFSSAPFGIVPRNESEKAAWPALKGKIFAEALEIFLRFLRGDVFSSTDVTPTILTRQDMRSDDDWNRVRVAAEQPNAEQIQFANRWPFARTGVIPKETPLNALQLYVGSHESKIQDFANTLMPCGVLNLSITPGEEIERAHSRMPNTFHPAGGTWRRSFMPRTALVFIDATPGLNATQQSARAHEKARKALNTYWNALEGTLDPARIENAVNNALVGNPMEIAAQLKDRFHSDDRLMLWFDFFNHNSQEVITAMRDFQRFVAPLVNGKN